MRFLLIPAFILACATKDDTSTDTSGLSPEDERAAQLWEELSGYSDWDQHADWTGVVASDDGTHGPFVSIWMNDVASDAIATFDGEDLPEGSILVKEGYADESAESANGITVMVKESGWGDDGWFWAKFAGDGSGDIQLAGSVSGCTGCHSSGQDSVKFVTW